VTPAAGLDLPANKGGREVARRIAGARIDPPDDIAPLVEANQQTFGRIFGFAERPPALSRARPGGVARALAMAGLAADADLGPGGGEAVVGGVVILAHAGRVALGALTPTFEASFMRTNWLNFPAGQTRAQNRLGGFPRRVSVAAR
jgi:hypothetical protein